MDRQQWTELNLSHVNTPHQIQLVSSHHQREGNLYLVIDDVKGENTDSINIFLVASSPKSPVIAECYKKC